MPSSETRPAGASRKSGPSSSATPTNRAPKASDISVGAKMMSNRSGNGVMVAGTDLAGLSSNSGNLVAGARTILPPTEGTIGSGNRSTNSMRSATARRSSNGCRFMAGALGGEISDKKGLVVSARSMVVVRCTACVFLSDTQPVRRQVPSKPSPSQSVRFP
eukprot:2096606-Prymnesium_polylepis.1